MRDWDTSASFNKASRIPMDRQTAIEATVSSYATKTMGTGGATALAGGLTSNEYMAIAGVILAALGFLTNLWFQHRRDKREEVEHNRRMEQMASERGDL